MELNLIEKLISKMGNIKRFQEKRPSILELRVIFEAVRVSPSAENAQPWRYFIVEEEKRNFILSKIRKNEDFEILKTAPILCVVTARKVLIDRRSSEILFYQIDIPISLIDAKLAALYLDLDIYYTMDVESIEILKNLELNDKFYFFCLAGIGYPLYIQ